MNEKCKWYVCLNVCIYLLVTRTWPCVIHQWHDWWMERVYHNTAGTVCITLIVDVYVMCMHVVLFSCKCRKGPAGAGRCEDGVWYCVLNVGRGQRELVGVKTGYEMGRVSWNKMCLFKLNSVVCLSFMHDCETLLYYKRWWNMIW